MWLEMTAGKNEGREASAFDLAAHALSRTPSLGTWTMPDGRSVTIRPIRPDDESLMVAFHQGLSDRSVYLRYFHMLPLDRRIAHERLVRICSIDNEREMVLVAESKNPLTGTLEILGVGRLTKIPGTTEAEFALLVADRVQGRGLGTELLRRLLQVAEGEKLSRVTGDILAENRPMQRVCLKLGFRLRYIAEDRIVKAEYDLVSPSGPTPTTETSSRGERSREEVPV
jgi:acetyltransferase